MVGLESLPEEAPVIRATPGKRVEDMIVRRENYFIRNVKRIV